MVGRISLSDQAYELIKAQLLAGDYAPGSKLDAQVIADRYRWSVTPVRAALQRLVGESLVEARANQGFTVPMVSEIGVRALYDLQWGLLVGAAKTANIENQRLGRRRPRILPGLDPEALLSDDAAADDPVGATEALFTTIGEMANVEYGRSIRSKGVRLRQARRAEINFIDDPIAELRGIAKAAGEGDFETLEARLTDYHQRRRHLVPDLVSLIQRGPG